MDSRGPSATLDLSAIEFDRFTLHTKINAEFDDAIKARSEEIAEREKAHLEQLTKELEAASR